MSDKSVRSPIVVILLAIITFGIYNLYWIFKMSADLQKESIREETTSPGLELLLVIVTCGLYALYWYYKYAKIIFELQAARHITPPDDNGILYIVLIIFGLYPIAMAIMQFSINKLWLSYENVHA